MEFIEALKNVTGEKAMPGPDGVGSMVWGIKRVLSMHEDLLPIVADLDRLHYSLGDDRFYVLLMYALPAGKFFSKSAKKSDLEGTGMGETLERKVCRYFSVMPSELHVLMAVLTKQGLTIDDLKMKFGVNVRKGKASAAGHGDDVDQVDGDGDPEQVQGAGGKARKTKRRGKKKAGDGFKVDKPGGFASTVSR